MSANSNKQSATQADRRTIGRAPSIVRGHCRNRFRAHDPEVIVIATPQHTASILDELSARLLLLPVLDPRVTSWR
jgi:hypothetical protein